MSENKRADGKVIGSITCGAAACESDHRITLTYTDDGLIATGGCIEERETVDGVHGGHKLSVVTEEVRQMYDNAAWDLQLV